MIRWLVADVFEGLAQLETGSVDLVVTSPPFLALRSYLPADHPDKHKEIGSEATPAEFIDVLLRVSAELRRVLAPHGSICVELGDTYAGSGGGGGDYYDDGLRAGQPGFTGSANASREALREANAAHWRQKNANPDSWPLAKSKTLIPELYRIALAYGINPLTGTESPAGRWRVRNVVTWCRPNPPVGALGDKWRPATSDVVVACLSDKRYWDDIATRKEHAREYKPGEQDAGPKRQAKTDGSWATLGDWNNPHPAGAPLLDYWEIPPTGYKGAHYAVYPPELVVPLVKAMAPPKVCRTCGEPSRRIVEKSPEYAEARAAIGDFKAGRERATGLNGAEQYHDGQHIDSAELVTAGWTDCGHDNWRPPTILDPFAGSGTTLAVATGHDLDAIGIDLDERNEVLARERIGPLVFDGLLGGE